jgi:hypothetical protein
MTNSQLIEYYQNCMEEVTSAYLERRTDVEETIRRILDEEYEPGDAEKYAEHRYVSFEINGVEYMYDTLTTLIEFDDPETGQWKTLTGVTYSGDD